jgi:S1-C subfamily serine protease
MTFRDPKWHDGVRVFGYPYVPGLTDRPITVERGHVLNPETEAAGVDGYERQTTFVTSAIARPGNSGGPIVAQDGYVVGLVVRNGRLGATSAGAARAQPNLGRKSAAVESNSSFDDDETVAAERDLKPPDDDSDSPPFYRGIPASLVVRAINDLSQELGVDGLAVLEGTEQLS